MTPAAAAGPAQPAEPPVRVGVGPAGIPLLRAAEDGTRVIRFARRAEELGYAALCVGDHLDERAAPMTLLAAAACATSRITLAAHVLCNEFRNPVVLAHEARTIHLLSGERLELGVGVGWLEEDFAAAGIPLASFGDRLGRIERTVAVLRSTPAVSSVPLVIGGGGPRMLAAAARLADIVTLNIPLRRPKAISQVGIAQGVREAFERRLAIVREAALAAGRSPGLHLYVHDVHLGPGWHANAAAAAVRNGLPLEEYLASPHVLAGDQAQVVAAILSRQARYGLRYFSVPGSVMEEFAEVLPALAVVGR
jgi:probable F420-dependent oxidoreductase